MKSKKHKLSIKFGDSEWIELDNALFDSEYIVSPSDDENAPDIFGGSLVASVSFTLDIPDDVYEWRTPHNLPDLS
jgi:hypothetical protein